MWPGVGECAARGDRVRERAGGLRGEGKDRFSGKQPQSASIVGMKISYGIYQDLKGTPCAARPGHFVQCYALRYPRTSHR